MVISAIPILCLHPKLIQFPPHSKLLITLHSSQKQHSRHHFTTSHRVSVGCLPTKTPRDHYPNIGKGDFDSLQRECNVDLGLAT